MSTISLAALRTQGHHITQLQGKPFPLQTMKLGSREALLTQETT